MSTFLCTALLVLVSHLQCWFHPLLPVPSSLYSPFLCLSSRRGPSCSWHLEGRRRRWEKWQAGEARWRGQGGRGRARWWRRRGGMQRGLRRGRRPRRRRRRSSSSCTCFNFERLTLRWVLGAKRWKGEGQRVKEDQLTKKRGCLKDNLQEKTTFTFYQPARCKRLIGCKSSSRSLQYLENIYYERRRLSLSSLKTKDGWELMYEPCLNYLFLLLCILLKNQFM